MNLIKRTGEFAVSVLLAGVACGGDVMFENFERDAYAPWTAEGTAFGNGPAAGTLPHQMRVSGFEGKRLVNSYAGGDGSTGTLTSPEFPIEKPYVTFLIGGGGWAGKTCMDLVVNGKVVRTATGTNVKSGGSEELARAFWNVKELVGQKARIRIVDNEKGGWGHINVDSIAFSDSEPLLPKDMARTVMVDRPWLLFPVKNGGRLYRVSVCDGETPVREMDIGLAPAEPDWYAPLDVSAWRGKLLTVKVPKYFPGLRGLANIHFDDKPYPASLYHEALRPQFHLSPSYGWNNDPNGLVFYKGEYHAFFQHNPYGTPWGNMHWGHAVSKDLVHWQHLPEALYPDARGTCFSGSAATAPDGTLAMMYTAAGKEFTQCLVTSSDGRAFKLYEGNPVIRNITPGNRDPRLLWYAPKRHWVLALYVERKTGDTVSIFTSPDLKTWKETCVVQGDRGFLYECPDLYELPVEGESGTRWILTGASGMYAVGAFDGETFAPEENRIPGVSGAYYAAQTFSDVPDGRRIYMAWLRAGAPGMPFNQALSIPHELGLRRTSAGLRVTHRPARELEKLRRDAAVPLNQFNGELMEALLDCRVGADAVVTYSLRGVPVVYDAAKKTLKAGGTTVPCEAPGGHLSLRAYLDRTSLEIFSADGLFCLPVAVIADAANTRAGVSHTGQVTDSRDVAYSLRSIW